MKYNQFTYVQPVFGEQVALEYRDEACKGLNIKNTPVGYHMFDRLIYSYKWYHTYNKGHYIDGVEDLTNEVVRWLNSGLSGSMGFFRNVWFKDDPDGLKEVEDYLSDDGLEYINARASYLWTLFELGDKGKLPDWMPMTNVFNPNNKYAEQIQKDYEDDYRRVLILCSETKFPKQVVKFTKKSKKKSDNEFRRPSTDDCW